LRIVTKAMLGFGLAIAALASFAVVTIPGLGALICPYCFGFERLQGQLFIESRASAHDRNEILASVDASRQSVKEFFGAQESDPRIFVCVTETCYRRADGGEGETRGRSLWDRAVLISPRSLDGVVLTHELTHIEFHHRLGLHMRRVPAWFDEGLAVYVSQDPRYLASSGSNERCLADSSAPLPVSGFAWLRAIEADASVYALAACRVSNWLAEKGGKQAVLDFISRMNAGASFAGLYR